MNYKPEKDKEKIELQIGTEWDGIKIYSYEGSEYINIEANCDGGFQVAREQLSKKDFLKATGLNTHNSWVKIDKGATFPKEEVLVCTSTKGFYLAVYDFAQGYWVGTTEYFANF